MDNQSIEVISNLVQTIGLWAVFAWLFVQERAAHNETRQKWLDDIREIAGLRTALRRDNRDDNRQDEVMVK